MKLRDYLDEGILKPELEKGFPAPGVKTGASAPKGQANTMPKDKNKAKGQPANLPFEPDPKPKQQVIVGKRGAGMATAAHLARLGMKSVREWMELDETSKAKALAYLSKAPRAAAQHVYTGKDDQRWASHHMNAGDYKATDAKLASSKKELGKSVKRLQGIDRALKIVAKEELHPAVAKHFAIELYSEEELREMDQLQIDELKSTTLQRYADTAHQQAMDATYDAAHLNRAGEEKLKASAKALAAKRAAGVQLAQTKLDRKYNAAGDAYRAHTGINSNKLYNKEDTEEIYYDTMELFLEALMSPEVRGRIAGHEKAGNKVSDQASRMKDGEMEYSFVVTQPSGKRSRHIYHGNKTKHETMSPAPKSKEAHDVGEDDEDK